MACDSWSSGADRLNFRDWEGGKSAEAFQFTIKKRERVEFPKSVGIVNRQAEIASRSGKRGLFVTTIPDVETAIRPARFRCGWRWTNSDPARRGELRA